MDRHTLTPTFLRPTMTLSFEDGLIRMVVLRGSKVVDWATATPPEDSAENGLQSEATDEGYVECLRKLLADHSAERCRVVTDIPLYSSLLRHLSFPAMQRRYLAGAVPSEVAETIPFASDEVDVTWNAWKSETAQSVFAIAVPKDVVDGHVRLLDEAGVRPVATYSKAVALSLASGATDGVVVHMTPSRAAIVLVRGGMPLVVNHLTLSETESDFQRQAEGIMDAVERTVGYDLTYTLPGVAGEGRTLPVMLTGHLPEGVGLSESVRALASGEISDCAPPLEYPSDFSPAEYAVNLGLVLSDRASRRGLLRKGNAPFNLLPRRHLPRPLPVVQVALTLLALLMVATAFGTTEFVANVESNAVRLSAELADIKRENRINVLHAKAMQDRLREIRPVTEGLEPRLDELGRRIAVLQSQLETITVLAPPEGLTIPSLAPQGDEILVSGTAPTFEHVLEYATNLDGSGLFSEVVIEKIEGSVITNGEEPSEGAGHGVLDFRIRIGVATASESQRQDDQ